MVEDELSQAVQRLEAVNACQLVSVQVQASKAYIHSGGISAGLVGQHVLSKRTTSLSVNTCIQCLYLQAVHWMQATNL